MSRILIIAEDSAHAARLREVLSAEGLADEAIVQEDPTSDADAQARLHRLASLGTLAAGAAHELNNLLTYVTTTLDLLARHGYDHTNPAAEATRINAATECCDRMADIVRGMTGFAHCSGGDGPIRLGDVLEQALEVVGAELRAHAVLVSEVAKDLPAIEGNSGQLCQVFVNLLINAVHAVEANGKRDLIRMSAVEEGDWVVVQVEDNGPGIAADRLSRVFEAFYTTKPDGVGTGLGLFLSRAILRRHGGKIAITSAPGHGTRVSVHLPVRS